jgi:hypothetical protein
VPAHVRLYGESFFPQLLAERAKSGNRIDARVVPMFSLQAAHLRHQRLGAAHLHAVDHVCNLHTGWLNLRLRRACLSIVHGVRRAVTSTI